MSAPLCNGVRKSSKFLGPVCYLKRNFGCHDISKTKCRHYVSHMAKYSTNNNRNPLYNEESIKRFHSMSPTFDLPIKSTFILPKRWYSNAHSTCRTCWKCGKENCIEKETLICECGVIQEVRGLTYFQVLGIPMSYDVDRTDLAERYRNLQRVLHPDKFSQKSQEEQELSEAQSSYVNKAYFTLLKPLSRALYMLELHGQPLEEDNSDVDQSFLMEIMEINEELMDADSEESLKPIENENDERIKERIENISDAFRNGDISLAKAEAVKLKYYCNIDGKIKEIYQRLIQ